MDYEWLAASHGPAAETWHTFVRTALVGPWLDSYAQRTPWEIAVMEIELGALTYLFDTAPTTVGCGDDRVVAVWGRSRPADTPRDASRLKGFLLDPAIWSQAGRGLGHFVGHAAGGNMDMNLFPQAIGLNRGTSKRGRVWRSMERYVARHPGTPLFVRPTYGDQTWIPVMIDYGLLVDGTLWSDRFENHDWSESTGIPYDC